MPHVATKNTKDTKDSVAEWTASHLVWFTLARSSFARRDPNECRSIAPIERVCTRGGVVVMSPLTIHASSKAVDDQPRRVLHIDYAADRHLGNGLELNVE